MNILLYPVAILFGLVISFLFLRVVGMVSARLLGVRLSWWRLLLAGFLGGNVGVGFAEAIGAKGLGWTGVLVFFSLILVATMLFSVVIELLLLAGGPGQARGRSAGIPHPIRAVRRRLARWARYLQITSILTRYGLGPHLRRRRAPASVGSSERPHSTRRLWSQVRGALAEAGGAFVKLGQVLSTRSDLLPPDAIAELTGLQDKVPAAPAEAAQALLAQELGAPPGKVFAEFDPEPLAAASIAQVYRARLASGEPVVVKVQRPGIQEPIERDLDILLGMARTLEARAAWARAFGVVALAAGFAAALREELDFRVEARNLATVAAALEAPGSSGQRPGVRVPRVFAQHSTSRVLVIEWLDGVSVRDAGPLIEQLGLDRLALARALLRCFLHQLLRDGTFHADPHPGNVMVLRDGNLAFLDFGSVGRLDPLQRGALQRMLAALDRRNAAMLADALLDLAQARTGRDEDRLERALAQVMAQRLGPGMEPGPALFTDLFALLFEYGLAFPPVIGGVFRALVTLQGTLAVLAPDFALVDEARSLGAAWLRGTITPTSVWEAASSELMALLPTLQRLPRRLERITAAMEHGTFSINTPLFAEERDARLISRLLNRAVLAFLGIGVGIMAILLLGVKGGPPLTAAISVYQLFAYFGLFVSVVLILRVVIAILRERLG